MTTLETHPTFIPQVWHQHPAKRLAALVGLLGLLAVIQINIPPETLGDKGQTFVTIFQSIFIEAVPFLLAGSLVSGLIAVFVNQEILFHFIPRNPLAASLVGGGLGLLFPVCECGVVPVTRRLYQKGLPLSMGIAFLLAAPVVNPVVIASTYAAFGWGPMLWGRVGFSFLIAVSVGALFYFAQPEEILRSDSLVEPDHAHHDHCEGDHDHSHDLAAMSLKARLGEALATAGDDFLDMARYLIAGSMMAAAMQTLISQPTLLALGSGTVSSIVTLMALAFVLSVCSTVDAFLALAFVNSFTPSSVLAFLVFGPMVDIKSSLMFIGVFQRRVVVYLILLPLMLTLTLTVYLSLNVSW